MKGRFFSRIKSAMKRRDKSLNGCFWHGHLVAMPPNESSELSVESLESVESTKWEVESSACCKIPKTNREFWVKKILRNMERDREEQKRKRSIIRNNPNTMWITTGKMYDG